MRQAPRRKEFRHRGVQRLFVDVIERHQQQRQPLQRFQRAAAQHQRRGRADWQKDRRIDGRRSAITPQRRIAAS